MRRNYNMSDTTIAFIKWRQCLMIHNDNKVKDQPEQCKKLHTIYDNLVKKNVKMIKK